MCYVSVGLIVVVTFRMKTSMTLNVTVLLCVASLLIAQVRKVLIYHTYITKLKSLSHTTGKVYKSGQNINFVICPSSTEKNVIFVDSIKFN